MAEQKAPVGMPVRPCGKLTRHTGHTYPATGYRVGGVDGQGRVLPVTATITCYCPGAGR